MVEEVGGKAGKIMKAGSKAMTRRMPVVSIELPERPGAGYRNNFVGSVSGTCAKPVGRKPSRSILVESRRWWGAKVVASESAACSTDKFANTWQS